MGGLKEKLMSISKRRSLPEGTSLIHPHIFLATWCGSGLLRPASGTWGSMAAIPFGYSISFIAGQWALALAAFLLYWVGVAAAAHYERKSGQKDNQAIVIDEVVGMWIAAIPAGTNWDLWLAAFFLFRVFDVYKPWPASFFQNRKKEGVDVMMDDVVAGFYAMLGTATMALGYMQ